MFYWPVSWFGLQGVLQTLHSDWEKCQWEDHLHRGCCWTGPRQNMSQKAGNCINSFLNSYRNDTGVALCYSFKVLQNELPYHHLTKTFWDISRGQNKPGKNFYEKTYECEQLFFLMDFIRPTGLMVTRHTGGLLWLLLVGMSWEKPMIELPIRVEFGLRLLFLQP